MGLDWSALELRFFLGTEIIEGLFESLPDSFRPNKISYLGPNFCRKEIS